MYRRNVRGLRSLSPSLSPEKIRTRASDRAYWETSEWHDDEYDSPNLSSSENKDNNLDSNPSTCRSKEFEDYEKLLESGNFSDITITVGEKKFQVHKAIITSRSPVFEAMLKHDMKEKGENRIKITDITSEVMEEVLRFMYAAKVNNIENMANDLLFAAEKYSIPGLKELCIKTLLDNMKIKNALELLLLADMCNAADLKSKVIKFIVRNQKFVVLQSEFDRFIELGSKTQLELVRAMVAKN